MNHEFAFGARGRGGTIGPGSRGRQATRGQSGRPGDGLRFRSGGKRVEPQKSVAICIALAHGAAAIFSSRRADIEGMLAGAVRGRAGRSKAPAAPSGESP